MIPPLRRVRSDDDTVRQVQDAADLVFKAITGRAVLDGLILEDIALTSSASGVTVDHRLGRPLRGWIVIRKNANESVWDDQDSNALKSLTLKLKASGTVTVSLWVF